MSDDLDDDLRVAFHQSWDAIEEFYREELLTKDHWRWLSPIIPLLQQLRAAGYDQVLRAGQSIHRFGLSRSRRHGLRNDQPSVWIEPYPDGTMLVAMQLDGQLQSEVILPQIRLCSELAAILDDLKREPIT